MKKPTFARFERALLGLFLLIVLLALLAGCQAKPTPSAPVALPVVMKKVKSASGGWNAQDAPKTYTKDTLYDLMNGQSDAFFVYGFQQAVVQRFSNEQGNTLIAAIFEVDSPDSAYGLNSVNRSPQVIALGSGGTASPGQRLAFWQNRYFIQLTVLKPVSEADLEAVGQALSTALPMGGQTPTIVERLPKDGLAQDPAPVYFHQELSIQDRVFLGGENKLSLGLDTGCVLAQYDLGGQPALLMLCEFPDVKRATDAATGLKAAEVEDLQALQQRDQRLAAVLGQADPAAVQQLLEAAVK